MKYFYQNMTCTYRIIFFTLSTNYQTNLWEMKPVRKVGWESHVYPFRVTGYWMYMILFPGGDVINLADFLSFLAVCPRDQWSKVFTDATAHLVYLLLCHLGCYFVIVEYNSFYHYNLGPGSPVSCFVQS